MISESSKVRHLDLGVLCTALLLIAFGLIAVYSATHGENSQQSQFSRQLIWIVLGSLVLLAAAALPLKFFYDHAFTIYAISIVLLIFVLLFAKGIAPKRWISVGTVGIQPAEFAKIGTILALAKYLSHHNRNLGNFRDIAGAFLLVIVPFILIIQQPDLGSALVFLALILPILHWAGLSSVILFVLLAPIVSLICAFNFYSFFIAMVFISIILFLFQRGLAFFLVNFVFNIGVAISTPIIWGLLQEYQKNRILSFLGIVSDPYGLGYQVIQSKIAIGSGGAFGKGFLQGTQTHLRFLPEQHTDFIFSVIGEEFGFVGVFIVLTLFAYLTVKGINIAATSKSKFISLLVFGAMIILIFQIFVNIGMTIGIMPVTGLPLPFLSYGGSSLISNLIIIGFLLNASRKRFEYL